VFPPPQPDPHCLTDEDGEDGEDQHRALRPLQQITATARRVADRSLDERIALDGPDDEIKDLADTFNAILERLDRSFDCQRRFRRLEHSELLDQYG
jgi:nitrate/nitrite-specific signal transduction histidine kinase